jgi:thiol-disulfide isomerase/thioredoxin
MQSIHRVTTGLLVLLTAASLTAVQDKQAEYDDHMREAEQMIARRMFENALQTYKKAYSLKDKQSLDAALGMALAYRGLGAYKNVVDLMGDAIKLAGDDKKLQAKVLNMRGAALVSLADKAADKRLTDAEADFRAAIAASPELHSAQLNLGVTLLKMGHDADGVRELKIYVERAPRGPEVEKAKRMIEEPRRARENFAPDYSFTTKDGEFISSDDLKGKTVVLDFWGTWCKPCLMATPYLVRLQKKYAEQNVVFIGVAINDQEDAWRAYIDKNKMEWPQFIDKTRKLAMPFAVTTYPTYIVIDGEGIMRARKSGWGMDTDNWLEDEIKRTLKKK